MSKCHDQKTTTATCLAAVVAAMCASTASAQSSDQKAYSGIEEVIVTAQKREQSINEVGMTVNVFTGDLIRDLGISSAEDMARFTPGLQINEIAATGVPQYTIRGVGFQDYTTSASSTVGLYYDGVNLPYPVMSRGVLFDTERVEVLRGPQGDLYGRNTTGGQINFISRKPIDESELGIRASYSSYQTFDAEGFVSGALTDGVRGRLAFKSTHSGEGWQQSLTTDDKLGKKDVDAVRAILDFDLNEKVTVELNLHYVKDKSDNTAPTAYNGTEVGLAEFNLPYLPLDQYLFGEHAGEIPPWYSSGDNRAADWTNSYTSPITGTTWDLRPQRDSELKGASARLVWDLGEMTFNSLTSYDKFNRVEANDGDGGVFNDTANINTTDIESFTQEFTLTGDKDPLMWIAGLYYSKDNLDELYHFFMPDSMFGYGSVAFDVPPFSFAPILELDTSYKQETESKAVFGHIEWSFAEQWRLTLGARYTEEDRKWSGCTFSAADNSLGNFLNFAFGANLQAGDCGTVDDAPGSPTYVFNLLGTPDINDAFHVYTDTINTKKWMGKAGIDYQHNDDMLFYATVSHGFKSGGFNGANSNATQQLHPYGPEELTAYELGTKMTLLDSSMQINAATFYYDYKDKQEKELAVTFVGNIDGLTNVPKSEIYGAELEMQWVPVQGLNIYFGAAWLQSEVLEWQAVDGDASAWPDVVTFDASGIDLPQTPEWSYSGLVSYRLSVGGNMYLEIGGDFNYTDSTTGGTQDTNATMDYTLYNARITLGDEEGKWSAQLWSHNITDEYYYPSAFVANGPFVRMVGMPRTVGATVAYYW